MSTNYQKAAQNLERALLEDTNLTEAELRQKLSGEGVDVDGFLKRFDATFRKSIQARAKQEAVEAKARAFAARGSLFGRIVETRENLLALVQEAIAGRFGAEVMARCRNKDPNEMSDNELRSWLEDIEKLNASK